MKLTEIHGLSKEQVENFLDRNSIEFGRPIEFKVQNNKVVFIDSYDVSASVYGSGPFKLPFEFDRLLSIEINNRTIRNWSDIGSPKQANEWYLIDCELPPIAQMPEFQHISIAINPDFEFTNSIIPMFDSISNIIEFSIEGNRQVYLSIWKDHPGTSGKIKVKHLSEDIVVLNDTFELQDWLINNDYENLA